MSDLTGTTILRLGCYLSGGFGLCILARHYSDPWLVILGLLFMVCAVLSFVAAKEGD